jgi:hypothetical protein
VVDFVNAKTEVRESKEPTLVPYSKYPLPVDGELIVNCKDVALITLANLSEGNTAPNPGISEISESNPESSSALRVTIHCGIRISP